MSEEKSIMNELAGQAKDVLGKVYDDAAHPTVRSLGNTLSLLPRTIGVWLGKWEKWIINGEESIRLTAEAVKEKAKQVPEEKLAEPEPYVALPAIQQLSYCYDSEALRDMYANLLLSSMNTDTKALVHPAFVDIIKQLTPDEAKLLKSLEVSSGYVPVMDLELDLGKGNGRIPILRNYSVAGRGVCENPEQICSYLENLDRLKIIELYNDIHVMDDGKYDDIRNDPYYKLRAGIHTSGEIKVHEKKRAFRITDFGIMFIKTCVDNERQISLINDLFTNLEEIKNTTT